MDSIFTNSSIGFRSVYFFFHIFAIHLSYIGFFIASVASVLYLIQDKNLKGKQPKILLSRLPDLSFLDKLNYRSIGLAFPVLTLAMISGSIWARHIWGSYWNWNLREMYSLTLWLIYAVILHVRLSSKLRGKKVAFLSLFAFVVIIFSLYANCVTTG